METKEAEIGYLDKFMQRVDVARNYKLYKRLTGLATLVCDEEIKFSNLRTEVKDEMNYQVAMEYMVQHIKKLAKHLDKETVDASRAIRGSYEYCVTGQKKGVPKTMKTIRMTYDTRMVSDELTRKFKSLMDYVHNSNPDESPDSKHISKLMKKEERKTEKQNKHQRSPLAWNQLYDEKMARRREKDEFFSIPDFAKIFGDLGQLDKWLGKDMSLPFRRAIVETAISLYIERIKKWKFSRDFENKSRCLTERNYLIDFCGTLAEGDEITVNNRMREKVAAMHQSNQILSNGIDYCKINIERCEKVCKLLYGLLHSLVGMVNAKPDANFASQALPTIKKYEQELGKVKKFYAAKLASFFQHNKPS